MSDFVGFGMKNRKDGGPSYEGLTERNRLYTVEVTSLQLTLRLHQTDYTQILSSWGLANQGLSSRGLANQALSSWRLANQGLSS